MMTRIKCITIHIVVLMTLLSVPVSVSAHAGGLNPLGCHIDNIHGDYHCHYGSSLDQVTENVADAVSDNTIYFVVGVFLILIIFIYIVISYKRAKKGETKPESVEQKVQNISDSNLSAISVWRSNYTIWHLSIPLIAVFAAFTVDRLMHFIWAAVTLFVVIKIAEKLFRTNTNTSSVIFLDHVWKANAIIMALVVLYFGSWLPDVDWLFYSHRNPITHSVLPVALMWFIIARSNWGNRQWNTMLLPIFSCGVASHLIADLPTKGNIVWIPSQFDIPFLSFNALCCFFIALLQFRKYSLHDNEVGSRIDAFALDCKK